MGLGTVLQGTYQSFGIIKKEDDFCYINLDRIAIK